MFVFPNEGVLFYWNILGLGSWCVSEVLIIVLIYVLIKPIVNSASQVLDLYLLCPEYINFLSNKYNEC